MADSSIKVTENGKVSIVSANDEFGKIKVSVKEVNGTEKAYFVVDKKQGTIYSSETGETLSIEKDAEHNDLPKEKASAEVFKGKSSSGYVGTVEKKISYKQLSRLVKRTSTAATVAAVIVAVLGAAGLTVTNPIGSVASIIDGICVAIQAGIKSKSSKHGIRLTLKKFRHVRYRAGRRLVRYTYYLSGAHKY